MHGETDTLVQYKTKGLFGRAIAHQAEPLHFSSVPLPTSAYHALILFLQVYPVCLTLQPLPGTSPHAFIMLLYYASSVSAMAN